MTTLKTMYDGVAGSPETIITVQYVAGVSPTITVEDASVLPDAPNRVVLQRSSDSAFVTVLYGTRVANILGSLTVEAGFTGTYPVGSTAARRFTESDHKELRDNITSVNSELESHIANVTTNPHNVTKTNVGLGNCDNTSDISKPVSVAQALALGRKVNIEQGVNNANKIVVTNPNTGDIETLAKKTAFNSDIAIVTPLMDGTAAVGASAKLAREDHRHPTDTSRAPTSHASSATTYGVSSPTNYGHAMASSTIPVVAGTAALGSEYSKFARGDHVHPAQTAVSGNAGTATKLATTRAIDGVSFDGSAEISHYAVCSTAKGTAAKTVSLTDYTLVTGSRVIVRFTDGNVASSPTLNVNSTGAKPIVWRGAVTTPEAIAIGGVYELVYDGTNYEIVGDIGRAWLQTSYGFIVDESNSDPNARVTLTGASVGLDYAARLAIFQTSIAKHCVFKAAARSYYVDETNWAFKEDGTVSGVHSGYALDGDFGLEHQQIWWRITPLGPTAWHCEFVLSNPYDDTWTTAHQFGDRVSKYLYTGVFEGVTNTVGVTANCLRSVYGDTDGSGGTDDYRPKVSANIEQFYGYAQNTGTAHGLSGTDNTYSITLPMTHTLRCIENIWLYKTTDFQSNVARGYVDDTSSVIGIRACGAGVRLMGGYTQGIPATSPQAYTDNTCAVVSGEVNPYGNMYKFIGDFIYYYGNAIFATRGGDHYNITTVNKTNWDTAVPVTWSKASGIGLGSGFISSMIANTKFPFISKTATGWSTAYWADNTDRSADDDIEATRVPRCCITGGSWRLSSASGPFTMVLSSDVGYSSGGIGARLQCHSLE